MKSIENFLKRNSGKIVGVGDIFDHQRSSIVGEKAKDYLERTREDWRHIKSFISGNHDACFLNKYKEIFKPVRVYKNKNVLALHGHQLKFSFDQAQVIKYENKWDTNISIPSYYWDFEELCCRTFNKYFSLRGKKAYAQALLTLNEVDKKGLLTDDINTIITGHTHLPFSVRLHYGKKRYRVANCGSTLTGKKFKPIYIREIDRWFVSDLHLGTAKSKLNRG